MAGAIAVRVGMVVLGLFRCAAARAPAALGADTAYLPGHGLRAVSLKDGSTVWERRGAPAAFGLDFGDWAPTPMVWKGRLILAFKRRVVAIGEAARAP
jgi:hypothetical protein